MPVSAAQGRQADIVVLHSDDRPPELDQRIATIDPSITVRYATASQLSSALPDTDTLLVWDFTIGDVLRQAWAAANTLRWVHTASAGVDRLIFPEMLDSPVLLTNSRGVFDTPMAEYVLALVLALAKDLPGSLRRQDRTEWEHRETETIARQSAVVVGGGPIGEAIARLLRAVGMSVTLVGRRPRSGVVGADELPSLLPDADYLVLAAPLTEQTAGMVNSDLLSQLPARSRLINVGRGALVVEDDLIAALEDGGIAGAGLDVFATEPLSSDSPLWSMPNVIVSPHMSGDALGWRDSLVDLFIDNLTRYRSEQPLRNVVDKTRGYVTSGN